MAAQKYDFVLYKDFAPDTEEGDRYNVLKKQVLIIYCRLSFGKNKKSRKDFLLTISIINS